LHLYKLIWEKLGLAPNSIANKIAVCKKFRMGTEGKLFFIISRILILVRNNVVLLR
jgi:hypothetical protein